MSNDVFGLALPLAAGLVAWVANEWRKRAVDERNWREERYRALLKASRGFYANAQDEALKGQFIEEVGLCWLYCPDSVIRALNAFLDSVKTGTPASEVERELAFRSLILAMRHDIWNTWPFRSTSLAAMEYRVFVPSEVTRRAIAPTIYYLGQ